MIDAANNGGANFQFLFDKLTALQQAGNNAGINDADPTPSTLNKNQTGVLRKLTALHYAVILDNPDIIRALCTLGANKEAKDVYDCTPLYTAVFKGNLDAVKALLQQKGIDVNTKDKLLVYTPLILASFKGNLDIVKELLQHPTIDVNAKDKNGMTALMHAAKQGHLGVVQELLKQVGILIKEGDKSNNTAITYAVDQSHITIQTALIEALMANGDK